MDLNQIITICTIIIGIFLIIYFVPIGLWLAATLAGVRISIPQLIFMRIRKSPVAEIVKALISSAKGGVPIERDELEAFALAGGNIQNVINGMIAAKKAGLKLSFKEATAADFKGIELLKAVKIWVEKNEKSEILFE